MRILMLGWELPPHNSGGLGVACYQLCKALALKGVEIDFVVPYNDKHPQIDFMNVIAATEYSVSQLLQGGGSYSSAAYSHKSQTTVVLDKAPDLIGQQKLYTLAVKSIAQLKDYDIIHAHDWLTYTAGVAAKEITNKPLITHVHATEFDRSGEHHGNPVVHEIEEQMMHLADKVMAVSQATKNILLKEYNIPDQCVDVVYNSINRDELPALDDNNVYTYIDQMKKQGYKVVVNLGRLTVQKGLTYLLRAAAQVIAQNNKILFLLAGSGEQLNELIALSAQLGISHNVLFTETFVRGKTWRDAYAIGDMFVMPSVSEPFGIAPLEALGYGSVVLMSKQSGVGEILKNTMKSDYWDTATLADQILAIAEHDSMRQELLERSTEEFNKMSWHNVAQVCLNAYKKLTTTEPQL